MGKKIQRIIFILCIIWYARISSIWRKHVCHQIEIANNIIRCTESHRNRITHAFLFSVGGEGVALL